MSLWISNEALSKRFIVIDLYKRFYLNAGARNLLGTNTLYIGYDHVNKRLVIGKPGIVRPANVKPYKLDSRGYTSARSFLNQTNMTVDAPLKFVYVGKEYSEYPDGTYVFQLEGYEAPDGNL